MRYRNLDVRPETSKVKISWFTVMCYWVIDRPFGLGILLILVVFAGIFIVWH